MLSVQLLVAPIGGRLFPAPTGTGRLTRARFGWRAGMPAKRRGSANPCLSTSCATAMSPTSPKPAPIRITQMLLGRRYLSTTALYTQVATTMIGNTTSPFGRLECRIEATLTIFVGGAAERPGNRAVRGFARRARHGAFAGMRQARARDGAAFCRPLGNLLAAGAHILFPIARAASRGFAQPGFKGVTLRVAVIYRRSRATQQKP